MMVENHYTFPLIYFASAIKNRTNPKIAIVVPLSRELYLLAMLHGPKFFVYKKTWSFALEIFANNVYERFFKVERGDYVLDIGAHVGFFAIKDAKAAASNGLVVAVEPDPKALALLRLNVKINRLDNVMM
jgi:tRNA G46 methylase TrmB